MTMKCACSFASGGSWVMVGGLVVLVKRKKSHLTPSKLVLVYWGERMGLCAVVLWFINIALCFVRSSPLFSQEGKFSTFCFYSQGSESLELFVTLCCQLT